MAKHINEVVITDSLVLDIYNRVLKYGWPVQHCCEDYLKKEGITHNSEEFQDFYQKIKKRHSEINPNK